MRRTTPIAERLDRRSERDPSSGCLVWTGYLDPNGYGRMTATHDSKSKLAHVIAYQTFVGPVPDGLELDHLCRNRACIAVEHLEPVTHRENILRGQTRAARNMSVTHCPRGHPFDDANTYRDRRGWRGCLACRRAAARERYRQRRAS